MEKIPVWCLDLFRAIAYLNEEGRAASRLKGQKQTPVLYMLPQKFKQLKRKNITE